MAAAAEELSGRRGRGPEPGPGPGSPLGRAAFEGSPGGGRRVFSPASEFREFSRRQLRDMERLFRQYDAGKDGFIDLMELKLMMEKLGAPQTHLGLKNMIKEVDEDLDSKLSFREFLLIFRKAAAGELQEDSGLHALARLSEIDVSTEGVKGAKNFFEAKVMMSIPRAVMHEGGLVPAHWEQQVGILVGPARRVPIGRYKPSMIPAASRRRSRQSRRRRRSRRRS
uniref:Uncharacterized protein n=1 Tax=Melopsittacus undulatus TaxID=13146 RepID=A0A8V5H4T6_MELUD